MFCEERLRGLDLFSLEKGDLPTAYREVEMEPHSSQWCIGDERQQAQIKTREADTRHKDKHFPYRDSQAIAQSNCACSILEGSQNETG